VAKTAAKAPAKKAPVKSVAPKERPKILTKAELAARKAALEAELNSDKPISKSSAPTSAKSTATPAASKGKPIKVTVDGEDVELEEVELEDIEALEKELVTDNLEGVENIVDAALVSQFLHLGTIEGRGIVAVMHHEQIRVIRAMDTFGFAFVDFFAFFHS
jgi:hypothetical protein